MYGKYLDKLIFIMELLVLLKDKEVLNSMIEYDFTKLVKFTELLKQSYGFGFEYNINDLKVAGVNQMREAVVNEFVFEGLDIESEKIQFEWVDSNERGISFTNLNSTNKIYYFDGARDEFKQALESIINN